MVIHCPEEQLSVISFRRIDLRLHRQHLLLWPKHPVLFRVQRDLTHRDLIRLSGTDRHILGSLYAAGQI